MAFDLDAEIAKMKRGEIPSTGALHYVLDLRNVIRAELSLALAQVNILEKHYQE